MPQGYGEVAKSMCQCPGPPTMMVQSSCQRCPAGPPGPPLWGVLPHHDKGVGSGQDLTTKPLHFGAGLGTVLISRESKSRCCFSVSISCAWGTCARLCSQSHYLRKIALHSTLKLVQILLMTCNLGAK